MNVVLLGFLMVQDASACGNSMRHAKIPAPVVVQAEPVDAPAEPQGEVTTASIFDEALQPRPEPTAIPAPAAAPAEDTSAAQAKTIPPQS